MKILVSSDPLPHCHGLSRPQSFHDLLLRLLKGLVALVLCSHHADLAMKGRRPVLVALLIMHGAVPQGPGRSIIILEHHKVTDHPGLEDLHQLLHISLPILAIQVGRLSVLETLSTLKNPLDSTIIYIVIFYC